MAIPQQYLFITFKNMLISFFFKNTFNFVGLIFKLCFNIFQYTILKTRSYFLYKNLNINLDIIFIQKQPFRGLLRKRCSENMQQIHFRMGVLLSIVIIYVAFCGDYGDIILNNVVSLFGSRDIKMSRSLFCTTLKKFFLHPVSIFRI